MVFSPSVRTVRTLRCLNVSKQAPAPIRPNLPKALLSQPFRRAYADGFSAPAKRRGRGFFRWTWRLTYLSAIGGVGYLGYVIYLLRNPNEQYNPDPSKKTLVILGAQRRSVRDSR